MLFAYRVFQKFSAKEKRDKKHLFVEKTRSLPLNTQPSTGYRMASANS